MAYTIQTGPSTFKYVSDEEEAAQRQYAEREGYSKGYSRTGFPVVDDFQAQRFEDYWPEKREAEAQKSFDYVWHTQRAFPEDRGAAYRTGPQPPENAPPLRVSPIATIGGLVRNNVYNTRSLTPEAEQRMREIPVRFIPTQSPENNGPGWAAGWYIGGNEPSITIRQPEGPKTAEAGYNAWPMAGTLVHELAHYWHDKEMPPEVRETLPRAFSPYRYRAGDYAPYPGPKAEYDAYAVPRLPGGMARMEAGFAAGDGAHGGLSSAAQANESYAFTAQNLYGDTPKYLPEDIKPYYRGFFRDMPEPPALQPRPQPIPDVLRPGYNPPPWVPDKNGVYG